MAYDFPASPSLGTLFAPAGGPTWQWNGTTWLATAPSGLVPEAPADGQNYVRRNGLWVLAPGTAEAKNRIVNGAMQISQENGSTASTTSGYYPADQWTLNASSTGVGIGRTTAGPPNGAAYAVQSYVNVADATLTKWFGLVQPIEASRLADFKWGTASAKPAVLRFSVYSTIAGTFGGCFRNQTTNRTFIFGYTVAANAWQQVAIPIPPETTGPAWAIDTSKACELWFTWASTAAQAGPAGWQGGSNFNITGSSNGLSANTNAFYVSEVGLHADPQNTGIAPPWQMPDEAQELETCQRYWAKNFAADGSWNAATTSFRSVFPLKQPMRVFPAVTPITPAGAVEEYNVAFRDIGALGAFSFGSNFDCVNSMTLTTAAASALGHAGSLGADRLIFNARM